jgi:hypothetical protein
LPTNNVLLDDRLLVAELTGAHLSRRSVALHTTTYWYYRACRAAVSGGAGLLSGPFAALPPAAQAVAVAAMLRLPEHIGLPESRELVPVMVEVSSRHPRLNVMNVEAVATARQLDAAVLLSPAAARGVLVPALDAERIEWTVRDPLE